MFKFRLGGIILPNTPSKITTTIDGNNKTYELANGGEVNLIKQPKLTGYSFSFELNHHQQGLSASKVKPKQVLDMLEEAKTRREVIPFQIARKRGNSILFPLQAKVTVESYDIEEDAENNSDIVVNISLKQFRAYRTKHLKDSSIQRPVEPPKKRPEVNGKENTEGKKVTKSKACLRKLEILTDLNIRSGAGTHNRKVAIFKKGEKPFAYATFNLDGKIWYKIKHSRGDNGYGWISGNSKYVKVIKDFNTREVVNKLHEYKKTEQSARPNKNEVE